MRRRSSGRMVALVAGIAAAVAVLAAAQRAGDGTGREAAPGRGPALATSPRQSLEGCWAGTMGTGASQRRGVLEVAGRSGGAYTGRMHTLARALDTDTLPEIRVAGDSVQFTIAGETGRTFRGRLESGGVIAGEVSRRGSDAVAPFRLARTAGEDTHGRALVGNWRGTLQAGAVPLRLVYEVVEAPCGQVLVTMDSPDQGQAGLPVTGFRATADSVVIGHAYLDGVYRGALAEGAQRLEGTWTQGPNTLPLAFERTDSALVVRRPQEPVRPFPYDEEEVTYRNEEAGLTFAGTLTLPRGEGPYPAVLLITGSGAQDRDEALMGHRPFLVIADHLTRRGIAVLRVDDRGVGGSEGELLESTIADNAGDALAAVAFLKRHPKIDAGRIGLVGHSEGGWVAPLAAAGSSDVKFIVTLAGPAVTGEELLMQQDSAMGEAAGRSIEYIRGSREVRTRVFAIIEDEPDAEAARRRIRERLGAYFDSLPPAAREAVEAELGENPDSALVASLQVAFTPWFRHLLTFDPRPHLRQLRIPILALYGELDLQVPAALNAPELERVLRDANHPDFTVRVFPGLNHLFQHAETGLIAEYARIEETFAPEALELLGEWIVQRAGAPGDFVGPWQGTLEVGERALRLVFRVRASGDGALVATLDSPDQGATGIPIETVTVAGDSIRFDVRTINAVYVGRLGEGGEAIVAEWRQGAFTAPLEVERVDEASEVRRPQEPEPPYPYREETVRLEVPGAGIMLAGTLTLPPGDGRVPAVVLVSGSGPQDRDETLAGHRPFLVLADHLSRQGVAVLRTDDRGAGGSGGSTFGSTLEDRAADVLAMVRFLRGRPEIDRERIGLLGHSEGGWVVPLAALGAPDEIAFLVLLAGPAQSFRAVYLSQRRALLDAGDAGEATIAALMTFHERVLDVMEELPDTVPARARLEGLVEKVALELPDAQGRALEAYFAAQPDAVRAGNIRITNTVWFRDIVSFDPAPSLRRISQPVLALFGGSDLQVLPDANAAALARLLGDGGRADRTVRVLPGLNHLFQPSRTGLPAEYATIETTIAPAVLELIGHWLTRQTGR